MLDLFMVLLTAVQQLRNNKVVAIFMLDLLFYCVSFIPGVKGSVAYPEGCSNKPPAYYAYDHFPPKHMLRKRARYLLVRRIGAGKFSDVFEAVDEEMAHPLKNCTCDDDLITIDHDHDHEQSLFVIKCLKPVSERKIKRELLVLSHVSHLPSMARLIGVCWGDDDMECSGTGAANKISFSLMPAIILKHAGRHAQWLCHGLGAIDGTSNTSCFLSENEIKYYVFHLLQALDSLHSHGIMHRDVKPRNVLITRGVEDYKLPSDQGKREIRSKECSVWSIKRSLMLIDFGLADFYLPGQKYNVRVASRHYKAPELLINYEYYDYALDVWSVGCILAGLLLRREPFFRGRDNIDQLRQIASVLGVSDLLSYCERINVKLSPESYKAVGDYHTRRPWSSLVAHGCPNPDRQGLDLLDKLLVYDHTKRLTAAEAMNHSYFDDVRCFEKEV